MSSILHLTDPRLRRGRLRRCGQGSANESQRLVKPLIDMMVGMGRARNGAENMRHLKVVENLVQVRRPIV